MAAAVNGARMLACGDAEVVVAGGVEHMTRGLWVISCFQGFRSRQPIARHQFWVAI